MQADSYAGFNKLYEPGRKPGPILEAACWAHARRKLFELADAVVMPSSEVDCDLSTAYPFYFPMKGSMQCASVGLPVGARAYSASGGLVALSFAL